RRESRSCGSESRARARDCGMHVEQRAVHVKKTGAGRSHARASMYWKPIRDHDDLRKEALYFTQKRRTSGRAVWHRATRFVAWSELPGAPKQERAYSPLPVA